MQTELFSSFYEIHYKQREKANNSQKEKTAERLKNEESREKDSKMGVKMKLKLILKTNVFYVSRRIIFLLISNTSPFSFSMSLF